MVGGPSVLAVLGPGTMREGLMWCDLDGRRSTEQKIAEAIKRYAEKYGIDPNTVLMSDKMEVVTVPSVEVKPSRYLRPGYFLVGRDD